MGFFRRTLGGVPALLLLGWVASLTQAVTFEKKMTNYYDMAPKVRIAGTGFDTIDASKLKLSFSPKLEAGKDYKVTIQGSTVMVLSLQPDKKWVNIEAGSSPMPMALYLNSAKVGDTPLLEEESIQIATIVPVPTVEPSSRQIWMKTTPKLMVNGTNFNMKSTNILFDPPLEEGVMIQKQVLSSTQIILVKRNNDVDPVTWTDEPGPLKVVGINTGGGMLAVGPEDGGVTIAEVQADLEAQGITVASHDSLNIYQSTKELKISGVGFLPGTKIRFANALRGGGTNFTITDTQPEQLTLTLEEGSVWRKNPISLPGALVLLAADAGAGWVPLGPTTAKAGRKVATVFEDPSVDKCEAEIFRTHSHTLMVTGSGFSRTFRPVFTFDPSLNTSGVYQEVVNRTTVRLTLSSTTSEWTPEDKLGPLMITSVDTGAGLVTFDTPVTVATVVADTAAHASGVQVFPFYGPPLYQSSEGPIRIIGTGFKGEPVLVFYPPIWSPANYTLEVVNENMLQVTLVKGSVWTKDAGALMVKGINVGDGDVELANGVGVKVASILEDPKVIEGDNQIYVSHTKHFPVRGSGFSSPENSGKPPVIVLEGIPSSAYSIQEGWFNGVMILQLQADAWVTLGVEETKIIRLTSINTGAGEVTFPGGVKIAEVHPDSDTALCEDSCSFANDGTCDEPGQRGSSSWGSYSSSYYSNMMYDQYGWGYDDDANSLLATNDYSNMYRYAGYETTYQYYGMTDDGLYGGGMAPCEIGTDCSDCNVQYVKEGACSNTCRHARDNVCDDPRFSGECPSGTDCQDCGPWGEANTNFTDPAYYSSRSWLDDDDWEMMINDDQLIDGQSMNVQATYKRNWNDRHVAHKEAAGAGTIFVDVLWAMVVLVGCSVSVGGCMVAYRHFKAGGGGAPMYLPVQAAEEVELSRRGNSAGATETTPDVVRIG